MINKQVEGLIIKSLDASIDPKGERELLFGIAIDFEISENNTKRRPIRSY